MSARCVGHWLLEGATIGSADCFLCGRVDLIALEEVFAWNGSRVFFCGGAGAAPTVARLGLCACCLACGNIGRLSNTRAALELLSLGMCTLHAVCQAQEGVLRVCFGVCDVYLIRTMCWNGPLLPGTAVPRACFQNQQCTSSDSCAATSYGVVSSLQEPRNCCCASRGTCTY